MVAKITDTFLDQKEKSDIQPLSKDLAAIDKKLLMEFMEKTQNEQKSAINMLKNQLPSEALVSYKEKQIRDLKQKIDFLGIESGAANRTSEKVSQLQLFLFLNKAYKPDRNGEISEKKIDGKWGKETAEALKTFKERNPAFANELLAQQEERNQIEAPYINSILNSAKEQIGKPYIRGGSTQRGFDCSGLWFYALKKKGIKFDYRPTAKSFFESNQKISKESVKPGDFMFWKSKPGAKKHSDIYHIEMTVGAPYQENGKWYVKTLGSAKNRDTVDEGGNKISKAGVGYRIRAISPYHRFGRPSYYHQLAENSKQNRTNIADTSSSQNAQETAV